MPDETNAENLNSCPFKKLEETTRTQSYYVGEDYLDPNFKKAVRERSNHCAQNGPL